MDQSAAAIGETLDVIGIGMANINTYTPISNKLVADHGLICGYSYYGKDDIARTFIDQSIRPTVHQPGGAVLHSLYSLSQLGLQTAFAGKIGQDSDGQSFQNYLAEKNVQWIGINTPDHPTKKCHIFYTDEAERIFIPTDGAANNLSSSDIKLESSTTAKFLFVEGFLWRFDEPRAALKNLSAQFKNQKTRIAFTLPDLDTIARNQKELVEFISANVDVLFGNSDEISALTRNDLKHTCPMSVITYGSEGSRIFTKDKKYIHVSPKRTYGVVETTGAGDGFAAGFLYGLIKDYDLKTCAEIGNIIASAVIQHVGAAPPATINATISEYLHTKGLGSK